MANGNQQQKQQGGFSGGIGLTERLVEASAKSMEKQVQEQTAQRLQAGQSPTEILNQLVQTLGQQLEPGGQLNIETLAQEKIDQPGTIRGVFPALMQAMQGQEFKPFAPQQKIRGQEDAIDLASHNLNIMKTLIGLPKTQQDLQLGGQQAIKNQQDIVQGMADQLDEQIEIRRSQSDVAGVQRLLEAKNRLLGDGTQQQPQGEQQITQVTGLSSNIPITQGGRQINRVNVEMPNVQFTLGMGEIEGIDIGPVGKGTGFVAGPNGELIIERDLLSPTGEKSPKGKLRFERLQTQIKEREKLQAKTVAELQERQVDFNVLTNQFANLIAQLKGAELEGGAGGLFQGIIGAGGSRLKLKKFSRTAAVQGQRIEAAIALNRILTRQNRVIKGVMQAIMSTLPEAADNPGMWETKTRQSITNAFMMIKALEEAGVTVGNAKETDLNKQAKILNEAIGQGGGTATEDAARKTFQGFKANKDIADKVTSWANARKGRLTPEQNAELEAIIDSVLTTPPTPPPTGKASAKAQFKENEARRAEIAQRRKEIEQKKADIAERKRKLAGGA